MRVLTISDSDSYLKWAVASFEWVPDHWRVQHCVLSTVIAPSPAQVTAVPSGWPVVRHSLPGLVARVARMRPQVIVLSMTGPALEVVQEALAYAGLLRAHGDRPRPVLMGGMPGIFFPANELAIRHRRCLDLLVLHSHREVADCARIIDHLGAGPELGLATLPFLRDREAIERTGHRAAEVVFAAQSLVPASEIERLQVLQALAEVPPAWRPVVKVRAQGGERQAHNEELPYAELVERLPERVRERIEFRGGSMAAALDRAVGFVTVSSTAALEAVAAGVPALVLSDFGVSAELINLVFVGSGLLGDLDDLRRGEFRTAEESWTQQNYFHPPSQNTWMDRLEDLVQQGSRLAPVRLVGFGGPAARARRWLRLR